MAALIPALLGALLILPSSNLQRFDGLPLGTLPEFFALVLLVPLVASRALRRLHRRALRRAGRPGRSLLLCAAVLALAAKLALLASGAHQGFLACYGTTLGPPPAGPCERSWENPFFRFAVTRLDRSIDCGPPTLNLSFFNSTRFNKWRPGSIRRDRIPLAATWRGEVERGESWVARVTYVGEATVTVGATTLELPAHYGAPVSARLDVPAGRHGLAVSYRFDGSRTGGPPPTGPYATLRLARERRDGEEAPVVAPRAGLAWRIVAGLADGLVALLFAWLLVFLVRVLASAWPVALLGLGAGLVVGRRAALAPGLTGLGSLPVGLGLLLVSLLGWNRPRTRLALFFVVVALSLAVASQTVRGLDTVIYRSAGDDWLTYEGHARAILETWSLRGDEDVFFIQPLFRYVRFGERLLLGDGDLLVFAAGLAALLFGAFWAVGKLAGRRLPAPGAAWTLAVGLLLLTLLGSGPVRRQVLAPLSEFPTWIGLLFLFPLLFVGRSPRAWAAGAALAGLTIATRPNQAPATLFLFAVFLAGAPPRRARAAALAAGLLVAGALLPLAHNLYYGGRWVLFTTSAGVPETLVLAPSRLLAVNPDHEAWALAWTQVRYLLFFFNVGDAWLRVSAHGLQLVWLLAVGRTALVWTRTSARTKALLLLPAVYLAVHVFYDARNYFPRHVVVGYVAMGVVALYSAGRSGRNGHGGPSGSAIMGAPR